MHCTAGVRQVVTGLSELQRTGGQVLITSMCVGSGMSSQLLRSVSYPNLHACLGMGASGLFINERVWD